jgi:hypothetical protein
MKLILHIFAKDARHFWPEILVSLAVTAVLVWIGVFWWSANYEAPGRMLSYLASLLLLLVPVSWWILITRVIQAERLVGDTQFWITRPYTWQNLFAAKAFFLLVFLWLPFFIAQCLLLVGAGFHPVSYVPGLLYLFLLIAGVIVLPLTAIATVTSSFARMTLTLLGVFVGFIAFAILFSLSFRNHLAKVDSGVGADFGFALAALAFSAAIVVQYALRRVWLSRVVLIALPVLLCAVAVLASRYDQAQMDRRYLIAQGDAPIRFSFGQDTQNYGTATFQASSDPIIPIGIHLTESGVAEGYIVIPDAIRAEITAPDGSHWNSAWQPVDWYKYLPGDSHFAAALGMPLNIYRKFQSMPLRVHLALAATQAQATKVMSIPVPAHRFSIPDFGVCRPQSSWAPFFGQIAGIDCVSALRQPPLTYITTRWATAPCSPLPGEPDPGALGTAWVGSLDREPAELSISSVFDVPVNFSNSQTMARGRNELRFLCPGTPISFTQYSTVRRVQTSVDIQNFVLPQIIVEGDQITVPQ